MNTQPGEEEKSFSVPNRVCPSPLLLSAHSSYSSLGYPPFFKTSHFFKPSAPQAGLGWIWAARGQECGRRTGAVLVGMGQELGLGPAAEGAEQYGHTYRKRQGGNLIVL